MIKLEEYFHELMLRLPYARRKSEWHDDSKARLFDLPVIYDFNYVLENVTDINQFTSKSSYYIHNNYPEYVFVFKDKIHPLIWANIIRNIAKKGDFDTAIEYSPYLQGDVWELCTYLAEYVPEKLSLFEKELKNIELSFERLLPFIKDVDAYLEKYGRYIKNWSDAIRGFFPDHISTGIKYYPKFENVAKNKFIDYVIGYNPRYLKEIPETIYWEHIIEKMSRSQPDKFELFKDIFSQTDGWHWWFIRKMLQENNPKYVRRYQEYYDKYSKYWENFD